MVKLTRKDTVAMPQILLGQEELERKIDQFLSRKNADVFSKDELSDQFRDTGPVQYRLTKPQFSV